MVRRAFQKEKRKIKNYSSLRCPAYAATSVYAPVYAACAPPALTFAPPAQIFAPPAYVSVPPPLSYGYVMAAGYHVFIPYYYRP